MILRRYITQQVFVTTALVVGFLVVMLLGGRLIRYFGMAAEGGLQLEFLFRLIGYNLPYLLELILPISFFIALMLVFGRLYADSEMSAINAGGVSRTRLGVLLVPLVAVLFVFESYLSLVGKPWGVRSAETVWQEQALSQVFDLVRPKEFISSGNYHFYVGDIGDNRQYLADVIIIQTSETGNKDSLIFASRATQVATETDKVQLDLHNGKRYEISTNSKSYNEIGFETYRMTFESKAHTIKPLKIEAWRLGELWQANTNESRAELGYRFSLPFLMVLAVLFALPLSTVKPRQGRWFKLVPAMFVFVAGALILISLKNPIEKGKVGVWAYPVILLVLIGIALYMNCHARLMARLARQPSPPQPSPPQPPTAQIHHEPSP